MNVNSKIRTTDDADAADKEGVPSRKPSLNRREVSENPNGIPSQSPGLRGTSYPGKRERIAVQPQRGCVPSRAIAARLPQPLQGEWRLDKA